ncbi:MAG: hypothetical protein MUO76_08660 [Anaerolineaceae bacterium]|nr:hypothetical protein [Anaerolineaceae bacterium]
MRIVLSWLFLALLAIIFITWKQTSILGFVKKFNAIIFSRSIYLVLIAVLATIIFFALRNNFMNGDALGFYEKFLRDVPSKGAHVTHDEMWDLYIHSRFWFLTNQRFNWGIELSYQVLSCLAGGVFIYFLLKYCYLLNKDFAVVLFALVASG